MGKWLMVVFVVVCLAAGAWFGAAHCCFNSGVDFFMESKHEEAIKWLEIASKLNPWIKGLQPVLGDAYSAVGMNAKAIEAYTDALVEAQRNQKADIYLKRGRLYAKVGEYRKALHDFDKVHIRNGENWESYFEAGKIRLGQKRTKQAISDLSEAIKRNPFNLEIRLMRAQTCYDLGFRQTEEVPTKAKRENLSIAMEDYDYILEKYPTRFDCHLKRGDIHFENADYRKALSDFDNYAENIGPNNIEIYRKRGLCHYHLRQFDMALKDFEEYSGRNGESLDVYHRMLHIHQMRGNYAQALEKCAPAMMSLGEEDAVTNYLLGYFHHRAHNLENAVRHYNRALELDPEVLESYKVKTAMECDFGYDSGDLTVEKATSLIEKVRKDIGDLHRRLDLEVNEKTVATRMRYKSVEDRLSIEQVPKVGEQKPYQPDDDYERELAEYELEKARRQREYEFAVEKLGYEEKLAILGLELEYQKKKIELLRPFVDILNRLSDCKLEQSDDSVVFKLKAAEENAKRFPVEIGFRGKEWSAFLTYSDWRVAGKIWDDRNNLKLTKYFKLSDDGNGIDLHLSEIELSHDRLGEKRSFSFESPVFIELEEYAKYGDKLRGLISEELSLKFGQYCHLFGLSFDKVAAHEERKKYKLFSNVNILGEPLWSTDAFTITKTQTNGFPLLDANQELDKFGFFREPSYKECMVHDIKHLNRDGSDCEKKLVFECSGYYAPRCLNTLARYMKR